MKQKIIWLIAIVITSTASSVFAADLLWFTIQWYHVDMNIKSDGSMDVKETINTNFTEQRRWIFREIPIIDAAGDYIHIKNLTSIGNPVASQTIEGNNYVLKIWDPDKYVFWLKQYVITYTVENAVKAYASWSVLSGDNWQELYWNVIGLQRGVPISNSTFTITLPKDHTFATWNLFAVWWWYWEKNSIWMTISQSTPTTIQGNFSNLLQPNQGITVWLKFPSNYFVAASNYNDLFAKKPSLGFRESIKQWRTSFLGWLFRIGEWIIPFLFWIVFIWAWAMWSRTRWKTTGRKPARKSSKAITPYYLPPRNIEPSQAFRFWYNAQNPQVFVWLLYYWATKWRTRIELVEWKKYLFWMKGEDSFVIHEVQENPANATDTDKTLLQEFFGPWDSVQDKVRLSKDSYSKMTRVLDELESMWDGEGKRYEKKWNIFTRKYVLTSEWEQLFEEMRWFKEFLEKVERPVIDAELKNNPNFLNTILPWAVLFGVETRLLKLCEDMLQQMDWYQSYNWSLLNAAAFSSMTSSIKSSVIAPRSSGGSWSSWFGGGGWGGFSWWGGWGWGGGSR